MSDRDGITIIGLPELQAKLDPKYAAKPIRKFFEKWAIFTQSRARELAPVDEGNLRANIDYEIVDGDELPVEAIVGTNVFYAKYQEGGTGTLAELPGGKGTAHYPPVEPIEAWASRVGMPGQGAAIAR